VQPSIWHAFRSRVAVYGLTLLLAVYSITQLLQYVASAIKPVLGFIITLFIAVIITLLLAVSDLRNKLKY
jgi:hypothetical protein